MRAKDTRNIEGEKDNENKRREKSKKNKRMRDTRSSICPKCWCAKNKNKKRGGGGCQRQ